MRRGNGGDMLLSEILFDVRICADDALVKNSDIGWKELVIILYYSDIISVAAQAVCVFIF